MHCTTPGIILTVGLVILPNSEDYDLSLNEN